MAEEPSLLISNIVIIICMALFNAFGVTVTKHDSSS
jgi:hypothetical protein